VIINCGILPVAGEDEVDGVGGFGEVWAGSGEKDLAVFRRRSTGGVEARVGGPGIAATSGVGW
jgi:hypothetical protein